MQGQTNRKILKGRLQRTLRNRSTEAEHRLWQYLRGRQLEGCKFRRQHPIGPFIADFFCSECRLVIEIDSRMHSGRLDYDADRDAWMRNHGLHVIRVTASDISLQLDGVLRLIFAKVRELQPCLEQMRDEAGWKR